METVGRPGSRDSLGERAGSPCRDQTPTPSATIWVMVDDGDGWTFEAWRKCPACKDTQPIRTRYEPGKGTTQESKGRAGYVGPPCQTCHGKGEQRETFNTVARLKM